MTSESIVKILNEIIEKQDISIASIARRMNKSSQALNKQLNNDDMKVSTMLEITKALHCDIDITITDRASKKEYTV